MNPYLVYHTKKQIASTLLKKENKNNGNCLRKNHVYKVVMQTALQL